MFAHHTRLREALVDAYVNVPRHRARTLVSSLPTKVGMVCPVFHPMLYSFWLIVGYATVYICGNGGANPRHATLLAKDVPPSQVIRVIDRFLMYYIRTADKLMRTARWLENMEGGIEVSPTQFVSFGLSLMLYASLETEKSHLGR